MEDLLLLIKYRCIYIKIYDVYTHTHAYCVNTQIYKQFSLHCEYKKRNNQKRIFK